MDKESIRPTYGNPLAVLGNDPLLQRLTRDVEDKALSHAYIIDGKTGSGRHTVARHIAAAVACHHRPGREIPDEGQMGFFDELPSLPASELPFPCGVCEGCRKVLEGISPDVLLLGREGKATLGVDTVRRIRDTIHLAPGETDTKIYIIEDAETMTLQAQNALLLTLEEPPPYVLFLLLCNGADHLLETIRSRAPVLHTTPLDDQTIREHFRAIKKSLPAEEMDALLVCADGCLGQALTLADPKAVKSIMKQRGLADAFIVGCANKQDASIPAVIGQFSNKREEVMGLLSLIALAVRDLLLLKKSENIHLKYYIDKENALDLSAIFTSKSLLRLYEALADAQEELSHNGNVRLVLTHMCFQAGVL